MVTTAKVDLFASSATWTSAYLLRLASEGVYSTICQGQVPGVRGQAWGAVCLPDALLLVDVKYDVVTQLLYKEMLQEHHSKTREAYFSSAAS